MLDMKYETLFIISMVNHIMSSQHITTI